MIAEQAMTPRPSHLESTETILKATRKAAVACSRPDLMRRVDEALVRLASPETATVVLGEFKQGKSSLINALLNAPVCPVDDDVATAVVTVVHHAVQPRAVAFAADPVDPDKSVAMPVAVEIVPSIVLSGLMPESAANVRTVEFGLPRRLLAKGLRLVDTPGVGGMESAHGKATLSILPTASAVLFVTDASQELTATELEVLAAARDRCSNIVCVVSKTDLYPRWRDVVERNRAHLHAAGVSCRIVALSSTLRAVSVERDDRVLHDESGFAALVRYLQDEVIHRADHLRVRAALDEVLTVISQLSVTVEAERAALRDPTATAQLIEAASVSEQRAADLRAATSQWNTALNDGIADLTTTVDHDLRLRMRSLIDEVEALLDEHDPTEIADEFLPLVEERLMAEIAENHEVIRRAAITLAASVAEIFENEMPPFDTPELVDAAAVLDGVGPLAVTLDDRPGSLASVLTAMRGSYGGMVMFGGLVGVVGNIVSAAALGPVSLAVGAALGRKAAVEERKRQLTQRRLQATKGIKKHVDSVNLRVTKQGRDTIRAVHRELRDTHLRRAKELSTTATEAARAAKRAAETSGPANRARLQQLDRMADGLTSIRAAVGQVSHP